MAKTQSQQLGLNQSQHTPEPTAIAGPFSAVQGYTDKPGDKCVITDVQGTRIAKCPNAGNAAFIVRACNEYDRLVADKAALIAALREIQDECDDREDINDDGGPNSWMRIGNIVRAALAAVDSQS